MKLNYHLTILATLTLLNPIWLVSAVNGEMKNWPLELAQAFRTPDIREAPPPNPGGGTRGGFLSREHKPTALIPKTNIGLTLAEYPTFFVYLPGIEDLSEYLPAIEEIAEFWLADEAGTIYKTELKLPNTNGIVMINLPEDGSIPPLAVGKVYQWGVELIPSVREEVYDFDELLTSGWVKRIEISPNLLQELQNTTPDNHPKVYAEAGIWHETLDSLATLRQSNPNNSTFLTQWQDILESVGLENVANAPLLTDSNQPTETKQNQDTSDVR
ncbi:DUF928 domain-containing protein [Dapis sp. BLCC M126]|uniref:DUF928 domain-containing protein n=1 Tax=Dapis sp. BLCC M126 TaxID=3400189 RepID=UPI003CF919F9